MTEVSTDTSPCPFCQSTKVSLFLKVFDRYALSEEENYTLVRCQKCKLVYLNPFPSEQQRWQHYPQESLNQFQTFQVARRDLLQRLCTFFLPYGIRWKRKCAEKLVGVGRILDYGCGHGDFLFNMRRHQWEAYGIEKNRKEAEFARQTLGLRVFRNWNELPSKFKNYFDVISFWHTFSLDDLPRETLEQSRSLLKANGWLIIALPNLLSLDFALYHKYWVALDVPRRVFHVTPKQLIQFVQKSGFKLSKKHHIPTDAFYNCLYSGKLLLKKDRSLRWIKPLLYFGASNLAVLSYILGLIGNGSGMVFYFQKDVDAT